MVEFIFILLSFFFFNCNCYSILTVDYNYYSNIWHNFTYSGQYYDYFVLVGQIHNFTTIDIDFMPINRNMDVSYIFSNKNYSDEKNYTNIFYELFRHISPGEHTHTDFKSMPHLKDYPYFYLAFSTAYKEEINFLFKSNVTKQATDDKTDDTTDDSTIIPENKKPGGINKFLLAFIITVSVLVIIIIIIIIIRVFKNKSNDLLNKVNQASFSDNKTNGKENLMMDKND